MSKYVCDFEQVLSIGENMCKMAYDLKAFTTDYSSKIEGSLSSWAGEAKANFSEKCAEQVQFTMHIAKEAELFGEYIKMAAQKIEELDEELANLNI